MVIFLCVTLCVDAVKVDAISVNCSRNRIARSLIDSHFSLQSRSDGEEIGKKKRNKRIFYLIDFYPRMF